MLKLNLKKFILAIIFYGMVGESSGGTVLYQAESFSVPVFNIDFTSFITGASAPSGSLVYATFTSNVTSNDTILFYATDPNTSIWYDTDVDIVAGENIVVSSIGQDGAASFAFNPWDALTLTNLCITTDQNTTCNFGSVAPQKLFDLSSNAHALRGAFSLQSAIINNGLNYDCNTFDTNGICISAGGRITGTNNPSNNSQSALLITSYRLNDHWRIGGYLDQSLSNKDSSGINLNTNNPLGGVFLVWSENSTGIGNEFRLAAGYSDNDISITRSSGLNTEAGKGRASLSAQALSATFSRGFQLNNTRWIASPYIGVRYTKIKRSGYSEDLTIDVTTPLTYSDLSQETTSALAGVRFNAEFNEKINVMASVGIESDISHNTGDYAATGIDGLTPIAFNQNIRHLRPVASLGASYKIDKRQTVGMNLNYRQEAFNSINSLGGMINYQISF